MGFPLPHPIQHALIRTVAEPASIEQRTDLTPLWAGQSINLLRSNEAAELMTALINEVDACFRKIANGATTPQYLRSHFAHHLDSIFGRLPNLGDVRGGCITELCAITVGP
jgi:hypothetical protein